MPSKQVNVFNTSIGQIQISVNGGQPVAIPGTGSHNWVPQQPAGNVFGFDQYRQPNGFGPGTNRVVLDFGGELISLSIPIDPQQQIFSLQLYIFLGLGSDVSWVLLNFGVMIARYRRRHRVPFKMRLRSLTTLALTTVMPTRR
jgi:hypothetical protein